MDSTKINIVKILKEIELFSEFDNEILELFSSKMRPVFLRKGQTLFHKGDNENALYIILDGSVEIHDNDYIFTTLNAKQFFGEYSLIDSAVRSASVTAVHETHLLELQQGVFNEAINNRPELWRSVLISLVKRLRDYNIIEEKLTMRTIDIQKKKFEVEKEKDSIVLQKKELESINATKDRFFTILANDLKNPFTTVSEISESVIRNYDNLNKDEIIEYLTQIKTYSKNTYNLLENLLQWARSQTGTLKINFRRSNIKSIVLNIINLFSAVSFQKSISIVENIDEELYGYFDIDMVTTIIRNLVANSLKYTNNNGKIEISATENNDMITIEVADTGIGMDKETLDNLFKIDKKTVISEDGEKGTGLGMALIKEFVLKNGGDINVQSEPNVGTTVSFSLPKAL